MLVWCVIKCKFVLSDTKGKLDCKMFTIPDMYLWSRAFLVDCISCQKINYTCVEYGPFENNITKKGSFSIENYFKRMLKFWLVFTCKIPRRIRHFPHTVPLSSGFPSTLRPTVSWECEYVVWHNEDGQRTMLHKQTFCTQSQTILNNKREWGLFFSLLYRWCCFLRQWGWGGWDSKHHGWSLHLLHVLGKYVQISNNFHKSM